MTTHRVAAVQAEPVWLDVDGTTDKTEKLIQSAAEGGAELVAFPETWLPGYPVFLLSHPLYEQGGFIKRYYANSITVDGPHIERLRKAARRHRITVVVGFSERAGATLYISQVVIGPDGDILLHRRKLKPTHVERSLFGEGDGRSLRVIDSAVGRLGALNCFEHLQPLSKHVMYSQNEQVHVAGWPCLGLMDGVPLMSSEALISATRTYAYEGSAFVLLASQIMSDEGAKVFGTSASETCPIYTGGGGIARIFGPDTELLTKPLDPREEGMVFADIDLSSIDLAKNFLDPTGHYARSDVFQLLFDDRPRPSVIRLNTSRSDEPPAVSYPPLGNDADDGTGGNDEAPAGQRASAPPLLTALKSA